METQAIKQTPLQWFERYMGYYMAALDNRDQAAWNELANPVSGDFVCEYLMSGVYKTPIVGTMVSGDRSTGKYVIATFDGTLTDWESAWFTKVPEFLKIEIMKMWEAQVALLAAKESSSVPDQTD